MPLPPAPDPFRFGLHLIDGTAAMAVYAPYATRVELCLFDAKGRQTCHDLTGPTAGSWHGIIPGVKAGQRYGLRVHGPWDPDEGHLHNPAKLLLDPYARGIEGTLAPDGSPGFEATLSRDNHDDSQALVPRGVLLAPAKPSPRPPRPNTPWQDTVVYEAHVRGLTRLMPTMPAPLRGTYAGLGHPAAIEHLTDLGITALELLPIHAFANEQHLERLGLTNYWGYSTLGYFAPHAPYATEKAQAAGPQAVLDEVKGAVDALHRAGIEVILDVVYNHTCEGGQGGRHISWRGLANRAYYRHLEEDPGTLDDTTGTGNTLDFGKPRVVQMAMDSLRYWADEVGVDGFRFDLAATLGRGGQGFETDHPFLVGITTDRSLRNLKLIAEPWDVGLGGWQTGSFPAPMAEWNDRYRDSLRSFWLVEAERTGQRKQKRGVRDLATRLAGSSDVFGHGEPPLSRGPLASVNFVTAHDGFTLADLTAYSQKHNEANGEGGRDGSDNNLSWNHGAEGPTDDEGVLAARRRTMRNLLGTLLLSAGVPMIVGGDEFGRTQRGNNNAYCQDNEISWLHWDWAEWQHDLAATASYLVGLRREHPVLRPTTFYEGREIQVDRRQDLAWFRGNGEPATEQWWHDSSKRVIQMMRAWPGDADALILVNGFPSESTVTLPADEGAPWRLAWDSAWERPDSAEAVAARGAETLAPGSRVQQPPLSVRLYLSE